ncbi:hypothetical protein WA026_009254 [Henosepilachna vigintioctopunctata]|uniref:Uncharacterized protein n=1 Tax=Henosepilachna vigintioctopunctata TaxID=420089 RepID=A0AAW1UVB1_9CUCU
MKKSVPIDPYKNFLSKRGEKTTPGNILGTSRRSQAETGLFVEKYYGTPMLNIIVSVIICKFYPDKSGQIPDILRMLLTNQNPNQFKPRTNLQLMLKFEFLELLTNDLLEQVVMHTTTVCMYIELT